MVGEDSFEVRDLNGLVGGIGVCLLRFFKFLSSRAFQTMKVLDFRKIGCRSLLMRGQWVDLHKVTKFDFFCIYM